MYITGNVELMKQLNKSLVINIIRDHRQISRVDIARETGLNRSTVTNLVRELMDENVVNTSQAEPKYSGGRRAEILELNYDSFKIVVVNIGRYTTTVGLVDIDANIKASRSFTTSVQASADETLRQVAEEIKALLRDTDTTVDEVRGIGVSISGLVNISTGVVEFSPNLKWKSVPVKAVLERELGIKTFVDNCTRCVARGEQWFGAAKGLKAFACVNIGYGIGASLVTDYRLITGAHWGAAEIGHITVLKDGPLCNCGKRGCLEALAGGEAIASRAKELIRSGVQTEILDFADGKIEKVTAREVSLAARNADKPALEIAREVGYWVGLGISHMVNMFDPSEVILSGGVSRMEGNFLDVVNEVVQENLMGNRQSPCHVIRGDLGEHAEIIGAATLVLSDVGFVPPGVKDPFFAVYNLDGDRVGSAANSLQLQA